MKSVFVIHTVTFIRKKPKNIKKYSYNLRSGKKTIHIDNNQELVVTHKFCGSITPMKFVSILMTYFEDNNIKILNVEKRNYYPTEIIHHFMTKYLDLKLVPNINSSILNYEK